MMCYYKGLKDGNKKYNGKNGKVKELMFKAQNLIITVNLGDKKTAKVTVKSNNIDHLLGIYVYIYIGLIRVTRVITS